MTAALASLDALRDMPADQLEAELIRLDDLRRMGRALLSAKRRAEQREREYQEFAAADETGQAAGQRLSLHAPDSGELSS